MNIVTYFDYQNHIVFISTHTKISTPHEKAPVSQVLAIKANGTRNSRKINYRSSIYLS